MREPQIHSHITDMLPDDHPLANETFSCQRAAACKTMLHADNNECMTTWVETGRGNFCFPCFVDALRENGAYPAEAWECMDDSEGWGLPNASP